ncbi:branched-chain amino acid ABC transporter ATP-binding protein/permease [Dactylosporangium sp. CA-233914]|uniref:branched-chain amino acid ABC transporter ATP-binding protein/permease n=1 Tax=Dactylosporangium sp. CA-233914 TaxID=3239934 RepID=UPI003D8E5F31
MVATTSSTKRSRFENLVPTAVRRAWLVPLVLWIGALLLPALGTSAYSLRQIALIAVYALVVSGLNLSFGYAGELALGQVAVMAVGAYATAIAGAHGYTDILIGLAVAAAAAAVIGLVTGVPALRLSQWALGLVSFFLVLLLPSVVKASESETGGLIGTAVPFATFLGRQLDSTYDLYMLALIVCGLWFVVFRNLIDSRYGQALQTLHRSPTLTESLGVSSRNLRLSAYVIGALPAGLAGCVYAHLATYISPVPFAIELVIAVIAASVVGGAGSIYGAVFGAALLVVGPTQADAFQSYAVVVYGAFLLLAGTVFSKGLAGLARNLLSHWTTPPAPASIRRLDATELSVPGGRLVAEGVAKAFGGVAALRSARIEASPGQITALIGSNGAGKTTLLNVISGLIQPDEGTVRIDDARIDRLSPSKVARMGIGRSFQTPLIPEEMTAKEVIASGRLLDGHWNVLQSIVRLPAFRRDRREADVAAYALLELAGLLDKAHLKARDLPLGSRRMLEVLRCVAGSPRVIMLDEPAAGLDDEALSALGRLLEDLRDAGATIVVIEHNVSFVLGLADYAFAMELGRTIADGTPDEIQNHPEVIASYLGRRTEGTNA